VNAGEGVLLFVYGSLKRGFPNHACLRDAVARGEARTAAAYRLVSLGPYPGLASGTRSIGGELYWANAFLLQQLDDFEGDEYRRAPVLLADGTSAEAYFIAEHALARAVPLELDAWTGYGACT
jgi:gamma-glutamylcyclotransferase (GGCT)/AIG2-like uncharacterized protein YtfP